MKINYIISSTTNGATTKALEQVAKLAEENAFENYIVIVPETKSIAIERELLDLSKSGAFSNVFIYSFVRLLGRVGGIAEESMVSKQTCVMLLRQIILDNLDKLKCYHKAAQSVGFAEKIYDTIQQFKSSGVNLEDLNVAMNSGNEALKAKLEDISFVFSEYQRVLGDGLFDDCDRLNMLGQFAKTNEFLKSAEIFIVGFDNVTTEMVSVLKEFAVNSKSITFSCCYFAENRKDKHIQNNELYKKFISIAEKLKYPYIPTVHNPTFSGDFWNIQNYLYSTENKKVASKGEVQVFEYQTKQKELEFVASEIIKEVKSGKRFRDIAIIDNELDVDEDALKQVLEDYEIPYFLKKSYDISGHFFVKFLKQCFDVVRYHLSSDKVLCWLSNIMTNLNDYEVFENYTNEFGINYSMFLKEATKEQVENDITREKINKVVELIKKYYDKFNALILGEKTVSKFIEVVKELAVYFDFENKLEKIADFEKNSGLIIEAEITSGIYKKFNQINENFDKFLGTLVVSEDKFKEIYLSGFAETEINIEPVSIDSVLVQKSIDGLYKIKDLFVVGAVEGKFPAVIQNSGIILDEELLAAGKSFKKDIEPTVKQINKRESYRVYETLLLPNEKLFVSYALKGLSGASNKPARVVHRILGLFGQEKPIKDYFNAEFISKKSSEKKLAKQIGEYLVQGEISKIDLVKTYNKLRPVLSPKFREYIENRCYGIKEFKLADADKLFFNKGKTSISQLEQYFACPYAFFVKYGLRLKENKKATLSSLDIGTIVHKFVELFIGDIKSFVGLNDKEFDKKSKEIFEKTLEELKINSKKNVAVLNFIFDESGRLAKYLFEEQQNSNFKNESGLNEFKFKGTNAVGLKLEDGKVVSLEGVIDRIDKFGNYVRIIDYKTGEIDNNLSAIYYGKKIQLISYLHAATKIQGSKVAGLFYFPIRSEFVKIEQKLKNNYKMKGFLLDDIDVVKNMDIGLSYENPESLYVPLKIKTSEKVRETGEFEISHGNSNNYLTEKQFDSVREYNEKLCVQAITEILSGFIEPSPLQKLTEKTSAECSYCEFAGVCEKAHARLGNGRKYNTNISVANFDLSEVKDGD